MAIDNSSVQSTGTRATSSKLLCNGAADSCPPYDDGMAATAVPMDVDVVESCRERAAGLPFPGALLADGTFTVEYHNM